MVIATALVVATPIFVTQSETVRASGTAAAVLVQLYTQPSSAGPLPLSVHLAIGPPQQALAVYQPGVHLSTALTTLGLHCSSELSCQTGFNAAVACTDTDRTDCTLCTEPQQCWLGAA